MRPPFQPQSMHRAANKFEYIARVLRDGTHGSSLRNRLLDVGCRGCELQSYVQDFATYEGLDLFQNARGSVRYVLDVSRGVPFADRSWDYVVALDLLEHVDDFRATLDELWRITARRLVILLPNMAHALHRLRFLTTGRLGGKYDLDYYRAGPDRHRWVTILHQSDRYMRDFAAERGLELTVSWLNDSHKKDAFARVGRLAGISAQVLVWSSVYVLSRSQD